MYLKYVLICGQILVHLTMKSNYTSLSTRCEYEFPLGKINAAISLFFSAKLVGAIDTLEKGYTKIKVAS